MAEQYRREIGRRPRRGLEGLARQGKSAGFAGRSASGNFNRALSCPAAWVVTFHGVGSFAQPSGRIGGRLELAGHKCSR